MNLYEILGVPYHSTAETIKEHFRILTKKYHPDISKEPDVDYTAILDAYKVLIDSSKRSEYDKNNSDELLKYRIKQENSDSRIFILPHDRIEYSFSLENIMRNGIRVLKSFKHNDYIDHLGQDIVLYVKPFEARIGTAAEIELPAKKPCLVCRGSDANCYRCKGSGFVKTVEKIRVMIPQSIKDGEILEIYPDSYYQNSHNNKQLLTFKSKLIKIKVIFIEN